MTLLFCKKGGEERHKASFEIYHVSDSSRSVGRSFSRLLDYTRHLVRRLDSGDQRDDISELTRVEGVCVIFRTFFSLVVLFRFFKVFIYISVER